MSELEISRLTKRFGPITAVDDVTFEVVRGEVLGFLGPNGAGKSTTMKIITGFLAPDSGTVRVGGDDIGAAAIAAKRRIGYLPEGAPLYGDMTPLALLDFVAEVRGLRGELKRRRIDETIGKVNLASVIEQPIETLSKGFKRRVGLAQAILHDPEVLILDEPTDGLDPNQKHEVRSLITGMAADKVIVLSTHILEEVDAVCTRAVVISSGRVVRDCSPAELRSESDLHNAVTLSVRVAPGTSEAVRTALAALPDAAGVEDLGADDGLARFQVRAHEGRSIVAAVSRAAREGGFEVEELHVEQGRLDDVFRRITTEPGERRAVS